MSRDDHLLTQAVLDPRQRSIDDAKLLICIDLCPNRKDINVWVQWPHCIQVQRTCESGVVFRARAQDHVVVPRVQISNSGIRANQERIDAEDVGTHPYSIKWAESTSSEAPPREEGGRGDSLCCLPHQFGYRRLPRTQGVPQPADSGRDSCGSQRVLGVDRGQGSLTSADRREDRVALHQRNEHRPVNGKLTKEDTRDHDDRRVTSQASALRGEHLHRREPPNNAADGLLDEKGSVAREKELVDFPNLGVKASGSPSSDTEPLMIPDTQRRLNHVDDPPDHHDGPLPSREPWPTGSGQEGATTLVSTSSAPSTRLYHDRIRTVPTSSALRNRFRTIGGGASSRLCEVRRNLVVGGLLNPDPGAREEVVDRLRRPSHRRIVVDKD